MWLGAEWLAGKHRPRRDGGKCSSRCWNLIGDGETLARKLHDTQQRLRYVYRRLGGLRMTVASGQWLVAGCEMPLASH